VPLRVPILMFFVELSVEGFTSGEAPGRMAGHLRRAPSVRGRGPYRARRRSWPARSAGVGTIFPF